MSSCSHTGVKCKGVLILMETRITKLKGFLMELPGEDKSIKFIWVFPKGL